MPVLVMESTWIILTKPIPDVISLVTDQQGLLAAPATFCSVPADVHMLLSRFRRLVPNGGRWRVEAGTMTQEPIQQPWSGSGFSCRSSVGGDLEEKYDC